MKIFDINETGTLSFIFPSNLNNNYLFFNYRKNIYFIISKITNDLDDFYGSNFGLLFQLFHLLINLIQYLYLFMNLFILMTSLKSFENPSFISFI